MTTDSEETLRKLRALKPSLKEWKIKRLRVFGSVMHGDATPDSDIDLIADFIEKPGLLGFIGIKQDMEDILMRKVDLFTEESLDKYIRKSILEEARDV